MKPTADIRMPTASSVAAKRPTETRSTGSAVLGWLAAYLG
jgi:hypothetical protein